MGCWEGNVTAFGIKLSKAKQILEKFNIVGERENSGGRKWRFTNYETNV